MTISSSNSTITIAGNGTQTVFPFSFIGGFASNIVVLYNGPNGAVPVTLPTSAYTVSLNAATTGALWGVGGTVTYNPGDTPIAAGTSLTISRIVPLTQTTSISNQGPYAPNVIESALDILEMQIQQVSNRTTQFRGTWVTGTAYNPGDIVQDGANGANTFNYYICSLANTSGVWATDLANGDWSLSVSAVVPSATTTLTGAVTGTNISNIIATTITNNAVTYAKLQNSASGNALIANTSSSAGAYGELDLSAGQIVGVNGSGNLSGLSFAGAAISGTTITVPFLQSVYASVTSNALTFNYLGGALQFRSSNLITGAPVSLVVGAISITVPSGATLGTISGQQAQLALLVAYNGGSPVACIVNMAGGINLDETTLISPTTISSSATSASVVYSSSTVAANSPYRVVGYINITQTTAGIWASNPSLTQGAGGQAMASMQSLGFGQAWTNVSRSFGTTYYNTTSKPLTVACVANGSSASITPSVNGVALPQVSSSGTGAWVYSTFVVPVGMPYVVNSSGATLITWVELR